MHIIGIDPGAQGALVLLDADQRIKDWADMPSHNITVAGKKRAAIDVHGLAAVLRGWAEIADFAVLEQVASMPKQGVASTFAFGRAAMAPEMALAAFNVPFNLVTPAVWKRVMQANGDKDDARRRASQLMPQDAHIWPNKANADRAEAALMALYGLRVYAKQTATGRGGLLG